MTLVHKKLIFNPVLDVPWLKNTGKIYEKPPVFSEDSKKEQINIKTKTFRNKNLDFLLKKFPGLKKYKARAALSLSNNQLDKAIILLEVCQCYNKDGEIEEKSLRYLKNIRINVCYDFEKSGLNSAGISDNCSTDANSSSENDNHPYTRSRKVGVIIAKSPEGYKCDLL